MTNELIKGQAKSPRGRVHELLSQHAVGNPEKPNLKREKFLTNLKKRFGYTNEKSVDELERLLRQFYRMNKSLGIHQEQPEVKQPKAE